VINYVVRPKDWDEYGKKVKTDKRDAKQLVLNLDRYVGGNLQAFCVVRVPSEAEEQSAVGPGSASSCRRRNSAGRSRPQRRVVLRSPFGRGMVGRGLWKELVLPPIVMELLEPLRRLIQAVEQELKAQTKAITAAARKSCLWAWAS